MRSRLRARSWRRSGWLLRNRRGDNFFPGRFFFEGQKRPKRVLALHVLRVTIEHTTHFHDGPGQIDLVAKNLGAIGGSEDGLAHIQADLAPVDIERGHHFDVSWSIGANLPMHETGSSAIGAGVTVIIDSLDEGAGTIANANNSNSNLSHVG